MNFLETKEETVGSTLYILKAFPATLGLKIQVEFTQAVSSGQPPSAELIEKVICNGATIASAVIDKKKFDTHFSRKYSEMMELFAKIMAYNFGEEETGEADSPNGQSDTVES